MTNYGRLVSVGCSTKGWGPEGIWGDHEDGRLPREQRRGLGGCRPPQAAASLSGRVAAVLS